MKINEIIKLTKEEVRGKIICFPTDTVYGVGCMIDDLEALEKIYRLKHRDSHKPLAILVPSANCIKEYVDEYDVLVDEWMEKYWPGALTIIFNKKEGICDCLVRGKNTIGFRMPNSNIALMILERFGPLATTSVNLSNQPPMNNLDEIMEEFGSAIDYYITDKEVVSCKSSTIIDISKKPYQVLRQGDIKIF